MSRLLMIPTFIRTLGKQLLSRIVNSEPFCNAVRNQCGPLEQISQVELVATFKLLARSGQVLPLSDVEFRCHSQNGEDGILLYIFAMLGTTERRFFVEIGCGDARESNAANLAINHGWCGVFIDGDKQAMERGKRFYASHPNTFCWPPECIGAWVTRDNVNGLIEKVGIAGDIDLLSIDVDGMDYWIWDAVAVISPRVVIIEYQLQIHRVHRSRLHIPRTFRPGGAMFTELHFLRL